MTAPLMNIPLIFIFINSLCNIFDKLMRYRKKLYKTRFVQINPNYSGQGGGGGSSCLFAFTN